MLKGFRGKFPCAHRHTHRWTDGFFVFLSKKITLFDKHKVVSKYLQTLVQQLQPLNLWSFAQKAEMIELMQAVSTALPPLFLKSYLDNRHGRNCPKVWISELNDHEIKCACRCNSKKMARPRRERRNSSRRSSTPPHWLACFFLVHSFCHSTATMHDFFTTTRVVLTGMCVCCLLDNNIKMLMLPCGCRRSCLLQTLEQSRR